MNLFIIFKMKRSFQKKNDNKKLGMASLLEFERREINKNISRKTYNSISFQTLKVTINKLKKIN